MSRRVNAPGINLIKQYEGFRSRPYLCPAGYATIGYGHVIMDRYGRMQTNLAKARAILPGPLNRSEAEALLRIDLEGRAEAVSNLVKVHLTDNQFDALVSFVYNVGIRAFANSTLRARLNKGDYAAVPGQLKRWVYDGEKKLPGLVIRRAAEAALFTRAQEAQPKVA